MHTLDVLQAVPQATPCGWRHRTACSSIHDADYLIAATALVVDAELLTTNVRHFPMFAGLRPAY